jgi:hypothetical protein
MYKQFCTSEQDRLEYVKNRLNSLFDFESNPFLLSAFVNISIADHPSNGPTGNGLTGKPGP